MEKAKNNNQRKKRILPSVLISLSLPIIICFAVPLEIYYNNASEFVFRVIDFLPLCLLIGLAAASLLFVIMIFIPYRAYKIMSYIILALTLMCFLQGNYLNKGLHSLSGDNLGDKGVSLGYTIFNLIVWIVVVLIFIVLGILKDKKGIIGKVNLFLVAVITFTQFVTPLFSAISKATNSSKQDNGSKLYKVLTNEDLTTISKNRNVLFFCIDRFDEYYAEEMYRTYPEMFNFLDGFTMFTDNVSLYGRTFPSLAYMMTNTRHNSNMSRVEYLNYAYKNEKTMSVFADNNYMINYYTQGYHVYSDANHLPKYVSNVSETADYKVKRPFKLALRMLQLSLYRTMPQIAKSAVAGFADSETCNACLTIKGKNGYYSYSTANEDVLNYVTTTPFKTIDQNVFKLVHVEGCHNITADYKSNTVKQSESTVTAIKKSVGDCFAIINKYVQTLKQNGAYENATIIITGDHPAPINNYVPLSGTRLTALLVKPSNSSTGKIQQSSNYVAHNNIWATIMKSENITTENDYGKTVFETGTDNNYVREYIWQTYDKLSLDEYYYTITGSARNFNNWKISKVEHKSKYIMD